MKIDIEHAVHILDSMGCIKTKTDIRTEVFSGKPKPAVAFSSNNHIELRRTIYTIQKDYNLEQLRYRFVQQTHLLLFGLICLLKEDTRSFTYDELMFGYFGRKSLYEGQKHE